VRVERLALRDFRSYEGAEFRIGPRLTVVHGPNASGKTNLLEALYFGCTGRSFRTTNDAELVRFGADALRVAVSGNDDDGPHELAVGYAPGQAKRMTSDGAPIERLADAAQRPLLSVFSPDRLGLIKGMPAARRAHLDQLVAALWPLRSATRRSYREALAQRNALLARIRAARAPSEDLAAWNRALAEAGVALAADRRAAVELIAAPFAQHAHDLGLDGAVTIAYTERSPAESADELADELAAALAADVQRGFTTRGPHRDELTIARDGRSLRRYGSQGEQRIALLALLVAERDALADARSRPPLMLLDDVVSELDADRRARLVAALTHSGQAIVTTTEPDHVPGWDAAEVTLVAVR
jgi:DNA replication and repair protein RecF